MKRNLIIILVLVLAAFTVVHAVPIADPKNPHNMSNLATHSGPKAAPTVAGGTDEICIFCHTPHSAAPQTPLWSRPDPDTMGSFPVYAQPLVINQDAAAIALTGYDANNTEYPSGASRMCLSCHDGATSIGVLLGNQSITMVGGIETIINASAIIDLATSHPISFNYNNEVLALLPPAEYQLPGVIVDTPLDGSGKMQCTTCHDPHEDTRLSSDEDLPFWRHTVLIDSGSTLYDEVCESCHTGAAALTPPPIHDLP